MSRALADPHVMPDEAITSVRDKGHAVVRGLASAEEIAAFRPAIEAAVMRHADNQAPLEERGTYGKAFLQVTNIWQVDDVVKEFVFAPRFAKAAADLLGVPGVSSITTKRCAKSRAAATHPGIRIRIIGRSTPTTRSRCGCPWSMFRPKSVR
jgi:hypothetical protein